MANHTFTSTEKGVDSLSLTLNSEYPDRMYLDNCRLIDRYNPKEVSLAVLGDERLGW